MICPYCNMEMDAGYIDQTDFRYPLQWYPAKREVGLFGGRKRSIKLTYGGTVKSYRCGRCRKIIIDEDQFDK